MTSHTPTPWSTSGDLISGAPEPRLNPKVKPYPHSVCKMCWDFDGDAGANGDLPWPVAEQNQLFIVRAVNCHDELLAACKLSLKNVLSDTIAISTWRDMLRDAIAKAEGKDGA